MEHEKIIKAISELNLWGKRQDTGIKREIYLNKLLHLCKTKEDTVAVIGVRRAGKTYLCKQFFEELISKGLEREQTLYVNFEEPKFERFLSTDLLTDIYGAYKNIVNHEKFSYLVFDEIQNVPNWEKWVRIIQEKKKEVKIIITGSSSKLLSSEIATVLTGRTLKLEIFPLSFKEFLEFNGLKLTKKYEFIKNEDKIKRLLKEYITYGGFPKVVLEKDTSLKEQILKEIFEGIVMRDIVARFNLKDSYLVRVTAEILISNFSCLTSANKLRNNLIPIVMRKISPNQVINILDYLENAYLIIQTPIFSYKIKEQKQYPKKVYCIDTGLAKVVSLNFNKDKGKLYENIVAIELKRRGKEFFYWKNTMQEEVDFVIKEKTKISELINVCFDLEHEKTKHREVKALIKAMEEFKLNESTIITHDFEGQKNIKGKKIKYVSLWRFLLEE